MQRTIPRTDPQQCHDYVMGWRSPPGDGTTVLGDSRGGSTSSGVDLARAPNDVYAWGVQCPDGVVYASDMRTASGNFQTPPRLDPTGSPSGSGDPLR